MTIEELHALARRAVACKGWKWMPGMATYTPVPYTSPHLGRILSGENDIFHLWRDETIPRLRDPATLGCLLALVRAAWGADFLDVVCEQANDLEDGGYVWRVNLPWGKGARGTTEAEALVVALEAAP